MSVALQKVDGVTSVSVTLKEGLAKVTLKPGNKVTLSELRRVIERNGFTPRGTALVADAEEIRNAAGQSQIRISGADEMFLVSPATSETVKAALRKQTGKRFIVEGVVPAPKDNPNGMMEVKDVKAAGK